MEQAARADAQRAVWTLRAYDAIALATAGEDGPRVAGVYFAPEERDGGIVLILAVIDDARSLEDMRRDPRVSFMCSPGNASRWIQGRGTAEVPELDDAERLQLFRRLTAHAPGAQDYVDSLPVRPVLVRVAHLRAVEAPDRVLTYDAT
ncbi:MAG: pyridoxamine 5'-phosphate oxidase family protein [Candidatus Dormibacteria bacterium]